MDELTVFVTYTKQNCGIKELFDPEVLKCKANKLKRYIAQGGHKSEKYKFELIKINQIINLLEK